MKFAVGYQLADPSEESFVDVVADYRDDIGEVYFPWVGQPSGRAAVGSGRGYTDWSAQARMEQELRALKQFGIKLDLLFNANCYGGGAVSQALENQVISILDYLEDAVGGVEIVTTTSLAVARTVKREFPNVEVRASVNMRLGTWQAMEHVAGLFDSYHVQRDFNRDQAHLRRLKAWADASGKRLIMLANSGCLRFCPGQSFHDNMVAHDAEIDETKNIEGWTPHVCWNRFRDPDNWHSILEATWVRPEDLHHYDGLFNIVKLATRQHSHPRMVIHSYASRRHLGNLLDLFEPCYSPALAPCYIDNSAFPKDWFERSSDCGYDCEKCGYCAEVLKDVLKQGEMHKDLQSL
jgi:collagenase-like PrtC family protease